MAHHTVHFDHAAERPLSINSRYSIRGQRAAYRALFVLLSVVLVMLKPTPTLTNLSATVAAAAVLALWFAVYMRLAALLERAR